jgi:hypothetical protein
LCAIKTAYMQSRYTDDDRNAATSSVPLVRVMVGAQLAAMGCARFDLGVLRGGGAMVLLEALSADRIVTRVRWLRRENVRGAHVFIRPHGLSHLTLVDDLDAQAIAAMKNRGFAPALVVETSPRNFQAWLKHTHLPADREAATIAARWLASSFGGDLSSADWRHFGRLAGFTNQKPNRRLPNGSAPLVRPRECSGRPFPAARRFRAEVERLAADARRARKARWIRPPTPGSARLTSVTEFHRAWRYGGDLHRADMAWALYAAGHGLGTSEIAAAIRAARDLSKKGSERRQFAYAERTARKALELVCGCPPNPISFGVIREGTFSRGGVTCR